MKDPKKVAMGKKSRASGADFERRTRKDLEEKGWIADKFSNNVELVDEKILSKDGNRIGKLTPAKHKFCGIGRPMSMGTGFPDFIAFRISDSFGPHNYYEVIGVECKTNGYLDKIEKEKCKWLLENKIFSKILISYKEKEGRKIIVKYKEFK